MGRRKESTTVYLEVSQLKRLRELQERTNVPVAVYIREGVDVVLAKYEQPAPEDVVPIGSPS